MAERKLLLAVYYLYLIVGQKSQGFWLNTLADFHLVLIINIKPKKMVTLLSKMLESTIG